MENSLPRSPYGTLSVYILQFKRGIFPTNRMENEHIQRFNRHFLKTFSFEIQLQPAPAKSTKNTQTQRTQDHYYSRAARLIKSNLEWNQT